MVNAVHASGDQREQRVDPIEQTHQNQDLPRLLAIRAARGLSYLNLDSRPATEADAERGAARATLIYAVVVFAVVALVVAARMLALPHAGS
jgi:hypothetical protein